MNQAEAFVFKAAEIDIILHAYSYTDGETIGDLSPATHSALVKGVTEVSRYLHFQLPSSLIETDGIIIRSIKRVAVEKESYMFFQPAMVN